MSRALVVLSGGQDSTTCLFIARQACEFVYALTFDYGQRHKTEIKSAEKVADLAGVDVHEILKIPKNVFHGMSPLTNPEEPVGHYMTPSAMPLGIEPTFVPARNIVFLSIAGNRAAVNQCDLVYLGVSQEDYGGYPDCRDTFISAMEHALSMGLYGKPQKLEVVTPLLNLKKHQISSLGKATGPKCWEAMAYTHTCYDGEFPPNPFNHASLVRARGFQEAGLADPLIVRAKEAGKLKPDYPDSGYVFGTPYDPETIARDMVDEPVPTVKKRKRKKLKPPPQTVSPQMLEGEELGVPGE